MSRFMRETGSQLQLVGVVFGAEGTGTLQTKVSQKYQVTGSERQVWDRMALNNDYICFLMRL